MNAVLALDTSTDVMAIALHGARGQSSWNGEGGAKASTALLPRVLALLAEQGLAPADLQAVAFGRGPGAFTGLRTACAVAQGLALGTGARVLPVDSLLIVAEDAWLQRGGPATFEVGVAMDARMGELYAARYRRGEAGWAVVAAPALIAPAMLESAWGGWPAIVAGSGIGLFELPAVAIAMPQVHDRARSLLRLALQAVERGEGLDAGLALPTYLRDKVALTTDERAALRAREPT